MFLHRAEQSALKVITKFMFFLFFLETCVNNKMNMILHKSVWIVIFVQMQLIYSDFILSAIRAKKKIEPMHFTPALTLTLVLPYLYTRNKPRANYYIAAFCVAVCIIKLIFK